jgi:hypothetical protein
MSKKTPTPTPKSPPLADTHHTRSEKVRDAEHPTSDTFRADAQVETAEAGDDSALHSSEHKQDDADAKVLLAVSGEPVLDADKDSAVGKSNEGTPYDSPLSRGGVDSPDWHREDVKRQDTVSVGPESPGERNTEAVNALSNAPPYLLSRAETLYVAHCHAMDGEVRVHFNNLRPVERAAWLASARATES